MHEFPTGWIVFPVTAPPLARNNIRLNLHKHCTQLLQISAKTIHYIEAKTLSESGGFCVTYHVIVGFFSHFLS